MKLIKKFASVLTICFLLVLAVSCTLDHKHEYGEWTLTKEPTMETEGTAERTCKCGEKEEAVVPVLSTTEVWTAKTTEATCSKEGSIEYTSIYGKVTVTLEKVDHEYGEWTISKEPTKETEGTATRTCKYGETDTITLPVLTNTEVWTLADSKTSTCTEAGYEKYTSVYGEVTVTLELASHEYGEWTITKEPTKEAEGTATRTCKYGETETVTVPVLTNTEVWTLKSCKTSTCTEAGYETYTSVYGEVTVTLELASHEYGEWTITKEPTMETEGSATRICVYGEFDTVVIPALSNTEVWTSSVVKEATYNEAGQTEYTSEYGKVTVTVAKLVAPYDGKTYYTVYFDSRASDGEYYFSKLTVQTSYLKAVTFNGNGYADTTEFPFKYPTQIEMINPVTGEIAMHLNDGEGHTDEYKGYVDMETGVIVILNVWGTARTPFIAIPSETAITEVDATASSWDKAIVINYNSTNIYVTDKEVYFNVTIENLEGTAVVAEEAYASKYVYIKDANGTLISHFVNNGETLVVSDGYEGTYTNGEETFVVTGYGKATLNGVEVTYTAATSETYTLDVYSQNAYHEVTLNGSTYTANKPMVEITFDTKGISEATSISANKNIAYELPVLTDETHVFKGWFYDEACRQAVESEFIPTENDTLYALWAEKVRIALVGVLEGDSTELLLGEGDVIAEFLPKYGVELSVMKRFVGWYVDAEFETPLDENASVSVDDTGFILYAKWENLPAYYGTYYGSNVYNYGYGNRGGSTITIDENGNMSGYWKGIVTSYNAETQELKWKSSTTSTSENTLYFDAETGIIAGNSTGSNIGTDYYLFCSALESTNGKAYAVYGVKAPKTPSETTISSAYAQFVELTEGNLYLIYNNHIYTNATFETATGEVIDTVAKLKAARTLIVKVNGEILISVATTGTNFSTGYSNVTFLDTYYGTYTNGEDTVVLDGIGGITYGTKSGTYTLAGATFDVYLEKVNDKYTEYYVLTLNGENFTIEKPMVTYHFVAGEGHPEVEDISYNKNIEVTTLPNVSDEGFVFKGWFAPADSTTQITSFVPVEETTLYAKWNQVYTVTLYNGETTLETVKLESGKTYTPTPAVLENGQLVVGYYLDAAFETEFDQTAAITANTSVYAKVVTVGPDGVISTASNGGTTKIKENKIYPYTVSVNEDGTINLVSTNINIGSSESQFVTVFGKESIVTFSYYVESEGRSYDNLYVMVKRSGATSYTELAYFGGYDSTNKVGVSGTYMVKVAVGDTLALVYRKDSSGNQGNDTVTISNLAFTDGYPESQVTFVYNDGVTANTTSTVEFGSALTAEQLAAPKNVRDENSYKFDAWYLDAEFTQLATVGYEITSESLTLYARWKEKVTISFVVPEGATAVEDVEAWQNEAVEVVTEKEFYIFRGWYLNAEFTGEVVDLSAGFNENTTLYAKFEEMPVGSSFEKAHEVTIDSNNNMVTIAEATTTEDFQVYYFKLVASVAGKYNIMMNEYSKVGGSVRYANPKYVIYASDKTTIVKTSATLGSSRSWTSLEAGTYYVAIHLYSDPSKDISSSNTCWGVLKGVTIETFAHDEVSEAVEYTLGTSVTLSSSELSYSSENYILRFTATESKTYEFKFAITAWTSVAIYSNPELTTKVISSNFTSTGSFSVTVESGTTYYMVIGNNWSKGHTNTVGIETSVFAVRDILATKAFKADHSFRCRYSSYTATTTFTFDNVGNVVVTSSSSDHDEDCYDYYMPSFTGTYTYTIEGTTVTMTTSTKTMVFTLNDAENPTTITLESTTVSSSSQGFFAVGTSFKIK